jgi:hypothetical protein
LVIVFIIAWEGVLFTKRSACFDLNLTLSL